EQASVPQVGFAVVAALVRPAGAGDIAAAAALVGIAEPRRLVGEDAVEAGPSGLVEVGSEEVQAVPGPLQGQGADPVPSPGAAVGQPAGPAEVAVDQAAQALAGTDTPVRGARR